MTPRPSPTLSRFLAFRPLAVLNAPAPRRTPGARYAPRVAGVVVSVEPAPQRVAK